MKIALKGGKPASEDQIQVLERALGCHLPAEFRTFVKTHDGATPESNIFDVGGHNHSGVREFIPIDEIQERCDRIEGFPKDGYPIAGDDCGNFVFLYKNRRPVYFWEHELPDDITELAPDFRAFLDKLEPFDSSVELKPGQVKSIWIHPDFEEFIKQNQRKR